MRAPTDLFVVEGGDHSLAFRRQPKAGERTQDQWDDEVLDAARRFLAARGLQPGLEAT
jgi:hypothetical protein